MNKIKDLFKKIWEWITEYHERKLKREAIQGLLKGTKFSNGYEYNYQVELVLEQWIIKKILDGRIDRRKELAEKQAAIKEMSEFINYLKNL